MSAPDLRRLSTIPSTGATGGVAVGDAVGLATNALRDAGTPTPRLDAELLVAHAAGRDRAWLHAHPEAELPADLAGQLHSWVARRSAGEPIAYIRGFKEWHGLRLRTDRRALIPRPETEVLVDTAIAEVSRRLADGEGRVRCWEVGTGSGAVALVLARRFRPALLLGRLQLVASDDSPEALELASENLAEHGVASLVTLLCGELLHGADEWLPVPDIVVANLPYLTTDELERGEGSLAHEPRHALDGGFDGLVAIRRLVRQLPEQLAPGGAALLEVGTRQAGEVRRLVELLPGAFTARVVHDLPGIERVVVVRRAVGAA
jgi:release factor glutamine methyltransferase